MYSIVYTKKAVGDIANLKSAKLDNKAKALIEFIKMIHIKLHLRMRNYKEI